MKKLILILALALLLCSCVDGATKIGLDRLNWSQSLPTGVVNGAFTTIVKYEGPNVIARWHNGTSISIGYAGTDDHTVINAALNKGGKCVLTELFTPASTIDITKNVEISGLGPGTGLRSSVSPILRSPINPGIRYNIHSLDINTTADNTGIELRSNYTAGLLIANEFGFTEFNGYTIKNVRFTAEAFKGTLLSIHDVEGVQVDTCSFIGPRDPRYNEGVHAIGIKTYLSNSYTQCGNSVITNCLFRGLEYGFYAAGTSTRAIFLYDWQLVQNVMIACKNSIVSEYVDTVVVDDMMIDQTIQGVSFKDTSGVISNSYIGCHSTFPNSFAVRLWGTVAPVDSVRVHDNFLWNSNTTVGHYGLLIYGTTIPVRFSEIHHNTFQSSDCGIMIAGGAAHLSNDINFNQFVNCKNAIYVSAGSMNTHISWNKMRSVTTSIYDGGTGTIKTSNYDEDVGI